MAVAGEDAPGALPGEFAVLDRGAAIDEDMHHAFGE